MSIASHIRNAFRKLGSSYTCELCGERLGVEWHADEINRQICTRCARSEPCHACGLPRGRKAAVIAWCADCSRNLISTAQDLHPLFQSIRSFLRDRGISVDTGYEVCLVDPIRSLDPTGRCQGRTNFVATASGSRVVLIEIARSMPETLAGSVIAHELGHCWLAQCPSGRTQQQEEGVCELISSWWLATRSDQLSRRLIHQIEFSEDPLYGVGFRQARDATGSRSVAQIVANIEE